MDKIIKIPKGLQELHGEESSLLTITLVYLGGLVVALGFSFSLYSTGIPLWKVFSSGFIVLDIAGGVMANLSSSVNRFYQRKTRLRYTFIHLHILHPAILAILFPSYLGYFVFIYLYTISSCLFVNRIKGTEKQMNVGTFLTISGIALAILSFSLDIRAFYLISPLFMIKLILGFSVQKPDMRKNCDNVV